MIKSRYPARGRRRFPGRSFICIIVVLGCLLSGGCSSDGVTTDSDGNYVTECMAECDVAEENISYTVCLRVKTTPEGYIISVEDAGTEVPDRKDGLFIKSQDLFDELTGKNRETMEDVDVVSGATSSSEAILAAGESGLEAVNEKANKA